MTTFAKGDRVRLNEHAFGTNHDRLGTVLRKPRTTDRVSVLWDGRKYEEYWGVGYLTKVIPGNHGNSAEYADG